WWNADLWTEFYQEFLNIENASTLPDLLQWKQRFEEVLFKKNVATDFNRIFKEIEGLGYNFSY
ncbi:Mitotic checkpoint serine/threonineprotein kinase BUB1 betalike, partial [Caligus rogercresseyi]